MASEDRAFRLVVEYDGTRYAGWQRQANAPSVQQTLEEALERIVRHPVRAHGAGRTDAGVHALGQVVRIDTTAAHIDPEALRRGTNTHLPPDVRIREVEPCESTFDPRRDARLRHYRYTIATQPTAPALDRHRVVHVPQPLDWPAIERAIGMLAGEHDFRAFRSSACRAPRTVLTLMRAAHTDAHPLHHFDFECRSFLHNMIRLMSGLLLEIGMGKHPPEIVEAFFRAGERTAAFRTAPPHGLVLMRVEYA